MEDPQNAGGHPRLDSILPLAALDDEGLRKLIKSILVIVPHRGHEGISAGVCNHFGTWARIGLDHGTLSDPSGGFIEIVRGMAEKVFMEQSDMNPDKQFLVMVDNDQSIPWDAPLILARHNLPVVSGVVCAYSGERGIFACFTAKDENGVPRFTSSRFCQRFPGSGLRKVHQVGTGLICIRRDVFETITERGEFAFMVPEFLRKEGYRSGIVKQGEDFSFCDHARDAGFDIYVDFSVRALHNKLITIGIPQEILDEDFDANDWKPSALDFRGLKHLQG